MPKTPRAQALAAYDYRNFTIIVLPSGKALIYHEARNQPGLATGALLQEADSLEAAQNWINLYMD